MGCMKMKDRIFRDIVFIGSAGEHGALQIAKEHPEIIRERFPFHILKNCGFIDEKESCGYERSVMKPGAYVRSETVGFCDKGVLPETINKCICGDDDVVIEIGDTGVSAALWELGESIRSGFNVYADRIPVSQMTVELCELFGEDPYKCSSEGCFLVCTQKGNGLCERLKQDGTEAVVIGCTTESRGRVMVMGEIIRYIDKPRKRYPEQTKTDAYPKGLYRNQMPAPLA